MCNTTIKRCMDCATDYLCEHKGCLFGYCGKFQITTIMGKCPEHAFVEPTANTTTAVAPQDQYQDGVDYPDLGEYYPEEEENVDGQGEYDPQLEEEYPEDEEEGEGDYYEYQEQGVQYPQLPLQGNGDLQYEAEDIAGQDENEEGYYDEGGEWVYFDWEDPQPEEGAAEEVYDDEDGEEDYEDDYYEPPPPPAPRATPPRSPAAPALRKTTVKTAAGTGTRGQLAQASTSPAKVPANVNVRVNANTAPTGSTPKPVAGKSTRIPVAVPSNPTPTPARPASLPPPPPPPPTPATKLPIKAAAAKKRKTVTTVAPAPGTPAKPASALKTTVPAAQPATRLPAPVPTPTAVKAQQVPPRKRTRFANANAHRTLQAPPPKVEQEQRPRVGIRGGDAQAGYYHRQHDDTYYEEDDSDGYEGDNGGDETIAHGQQKKRKRYRGTTAQVARGNNRYEQYEEEVEDEDEEEEEEESQSPTPTPPPERRTLFPVSRATQKQLNKVRREAGGGDDLYEQYVSSTKAAGRYLKQDGYDDENDDDDYDDESYSYQSHQDIEIDSQSEVESEYYSSQGPESPAAGQKRKPVHGYTHHNNLAQKRIRFADNVVIRNKNDETPKPTSFLYALRTTFDSLSSGEDVYDRDGNVIGKRSILNAANAVLQTTTPGRKAYRYAKDLVYTVSGQGIDIDVKRKKKEHPLWGVVFEELAADLENELSGYEWRDVKTRRRVRDTWADQLLGPALLKVLRKKKQARKRRKGSAASGIYATTDHSGDDDDWEAGTGADADHGPGGDKEAVGVILARRRVKTTAAVLGAVVVVGAVVNLTVLARMYGLIDRDSETSVFFREVCTRPVYIMFDAINDLVLYAARLVAARINAPRFSALLDRIDAERERENFLYCEAWGPRPGWAVRAMEMLEWYATPRGQVIAVLPGVDVDEPGALRLSETDTHAAIDRLCAKFAVFGDRVLQVKRDGAMAAAALLEKLRGGGVRAEQSLSTALACARGYDGQEIFGAPGAETCPAPASHAEHAPAGTPPDSVFKYLMPSYWARPQTAGSGSSASPAEGEAKGEETTTGGDAPGETSAWEEMQRKQRLEKLLQEAEAEKAALQSEREMLERYERLYGPLDPSREKDTDSEYGPQ
ncbi:hypothetical protein DFH27DRAFT_523779 [Peziza echinospora]|nr:hypothetical protein DFH27DRAFT_523779 [Peziza echinospora]